MNLTELQEIAMRQQQQIEINQQLLLAKEKRLKLLKLEEQKNQQLAMLTTQATTASNSNINNQLDQNNQKLENLKQNVLGQELKIFKLKQLRNQILEYKLSNSNMYSELDLIKSLFNEKERELYKAINKVAELTKQIEQLRKIKNLSSSNSKSNQMLTTSNSNLNVSELDKLKQELQIRNKLNEQQAKKIIQQHELFNKKQLEVLSLDKRIEELKNRISAKRNNLGISTNNDQRSQMVTSPINLDQSNCGGGNNTKPSTPCFNESSTDNNSIKTNTLNSSTQSPSKLLAKFATKQEIANTYMNKFGMETYQKYQQTSMRLIQQQQQHQSQPTSIPIIQLVSNHIKQASQDDTSTESSSTASNPPNNNNTNNNSNTNNPSSSSSLISLSSPIQKTNQSNNNNTANNTISSSTLPSHLKLEFDKIKYLPDMVKTIKKRHSISEVEGSSNTIPPQIFQKILEKHHNNKNYEQLNQQSSSSAQQQQQQQQQTIKMNKLNDIDEMAESSNSSANSPPLPLSNENKKSPTETILDQEMNVVTTANINKPVIPSSTTVTITSPNTSNTANTTNNLNKPSGVYLSTFMPQHNNNNNSNNNTQTIQTLDEIKIEEKLEIKSTKSIIKQNSNIQFNINDENDIVNRRVNFDPHALLLDAAVEGELDLVVKCSNKIKDVSEPNDEGITALHNSVCAGHFDIVKFLVEYGCDINYADNDGWTPLHCAASCNNIQMIKFLIENGAAIYSTTLSDNETAIRKCEEDEEGFQMCYEYLHSAQMNLGNPDYNNGVVYALYSYEAQNEDELSFKCFDELVVLDKHEDEEKGDANDGWWTCRLVSNPTSEGLVPRNYLGVSFLIN